MLPNLFMDDKNDEILRKPFTIKVLNDKLEKYGSNK